MSGLALRQEPRLDVVALLVDDDDAFLEELAEGLAPLGIRACRAGDATEALALLDSRAEISVIVVDVGLPRIDGLELIRKLKSRRRERPLPAIVLTGEATLERAVAALRADAVDFLQKPVDASEVAQAIHAAADAAAGLPPSLSAGEPRQKPPQERIGSLMALRKERKKIFGADLFEDPVWEMLLDLANADARGREVPVTSLCLVSGVSTTTALRRIDDMAEAGLVTRRRDLTDGRRVLVGLTDDGRAKVERYLSSLERTLG